jgi:hypothetical protein
MYICKPGVEPKPEEAVMVSKQDLMQLAKELKRRDVPAILLEVAGEGEDFNLAVMREAMMPGVLPKRPASKMTELVKAQYKAECLETLRGIAQELAGVSVNLPAAEAPLEREPQEDRLAPQEAQGGPDPADSGSLLPGFQAETDQKGAFSFRPRPYSRAARMPRSFSAPEGMTRMLLNVPSDIHKKLKLRAVQEGTTMTDIILSAIVRGLDAD